MDKKEPIKISLPLFIVLLIAIVYGVFMYMQNAKLEAEIANLRSEITQSQAAKNELQERLNSISSIASKKEDTEEIKTSTKTSDNQKSNNKEDIDNIAGTWKVTKIYKNDIEETDTRILFGSGGLGEGLILKKDKTFSDEIGVTISAEDSVEGRYEVVGNSVYIEYSGGEVKELKYDSKNKTLEYPNYITEEYKLVLKK